MGKPLSKEIIKRIHVYYEDDLYTRQCPGKKDFVSVKLEFVRVQMQKRLLLINLKELFAAYRELYGPEI